MSINREYAAKLLTDVDAHETETALARAVLARLAPSLVGPTPGGRTTDRIPPREWVDRAAVELNAWARKEGHVPHAREAEGRPTAIIERGLASRLMGEHYSDDHTDARLARDILARLNPGVLTRPAGMLFTDGELVARARLELALWAGHDVVSPCDHAHD